MLARPIITVISLIGLLTPAAHAANTGELRLTDAVGMAVESYEPGTEIFIRVEDPDLNTDPLFLESTLARVVSSTEEGGQPAASTVPAAAAGNTGNGGLLDIQMNDLTGTENWTVTCTSAQTNSWRDSPINAYVDVFTFSVTGSASGMQRNYVFIPGHDDGYRTAGGDVAFRLEVGSVPFAVGDSFTFTTIAAEIGGETVFLTETGPNTGVFIGSITSLSSGTVQTGNGFLEVTKGDRLTAYYDDASGDWGALVRRKDAALYDATVVRGTTYTTDVTWTRAESPYLVTGDVTVHTNATLTIEPGVTVLFLPYQDDTTGGLSPYNSELIVYGQIVATGTATDPIVLTSSANQPTPGDWGGIYFNNCCTWTSTIFEQLKLEYSSYGIRKDSSYRNLTVTNSIIRFTSGNGIYAQSSGSVMVSACTITGNAESAIYASTWGGSSTIINGNTLANNGLYGIQYSGSSSFSMAGNTLQDNAEGGVRANFHEGGGSPVFTGNIISGNNGQGISLTSGSYDVLGRIEDNTLEGNRSDGLSMSGKMSADVLDNHIIGNNDGISFSGTGNSKVHGNAILNNRSYGVSLYGYAQAAISYNDIYGNGGSWNPHFAISNGTSFPVSARNNWWGAAETLEMEVGVNPKNLSFIHDAFDDPAKGQVNYSGWLSAGMSDADGDGLEDASETKGCTDPLLADTDGDGLLDGLEDKNLNGRVDADETNPCNPDTDADGHLDGADQLPLDPTEWVDSDGDGMGDNSDSCPLVPGDDPDGDRVCGANDNCSYYFNPDQADCDHDGIGDVCDYDSFCSQDSDWDGLKNNIDNCLYYYNPDQADCDRDGIGDVCDYDSFCSQDSDWDWVKNGTDNCPHIWNSDQADCDHDGIGNLCDSDSPCSTDSDGDRVVDSIDNCGQLFNPDQADCDGDGLGDKCDPESPCIQDRDFDGVMDDVDNCLDDGSPAVKSAEQDDFESGTPPLTWSTAGDGVWEISAQDPLLGSQSMVSPALRDGQSATLELARNCEPGVIGFTYRVDSEEDYDFLKFYIDDELRATWSGSIGYTGSTMATANDYTPATFPINQGWHTFKWEYSKDESVSTGRDRAWIDNVFFGPGSPPWPDNDYDFIPDIFDNCPKARNTPQSDLDHDGIGDICETDNQQAFDSFETGKLDHFPWVTGGDGKWYVPTSSYYWHDMPFEGRFAARTPWLSDNQEARLSLKMQASHGVMSFHYRVDSEKDGDVLAFYIDDQLKGSWSGSAGYTPSSYMGYTPSGWQGYTPSTAVPFTAQVSSGTHTFKWVYKKNGANAAGADAAWIDNVTLPYQPVVQIPGHNPDQTDSDHDGRGDVCDKCPLDPYNDADRDGICGNEDCCPGTKTGDLADASGCSAIQSDADGDGFAGPFCGGPDCNDNDPLEHPGQVWHKDLDGDSVSDGQTTTSCARPSGYATAGELTALSGDADDDGDGMEDAWERLHGLDPTRNDALVDSDGDGFTNRREFMGGSLPEDGGSLPPVSSDADTDADGSDLAALAREFGRTDCNTAPAGCAFDFDGNGAVDENDLGLFLPEYGREDLPLPALP